MVAATHNRAERLDQLLDSLREQTLASEEFEVIVVDDASGPETAAALRRQKERGGLRLRTVRRDVSGGPGGARNDGWRLAASDLIVFTDDDCVLAPRHLEVVLAASVAHPGAFIQGRTVANPAEADSYNAFSHSVWVEELGPAYQTCNIAYPRRILDELGGFDQESFTMTGEDTDLAWRCLEAGVEAVFAPEALAYHAVMQIGWRGKLRMASRWHESILLFARYPKRGRKILHYGIFWYETHAWLARFAIAIALPKRLWPLRWWLAAPYVVHLTQRRSGPLLVPFFIVHDLVEVAACVRGSVRYRTFVL